MELSHATPTSPPTDRVANVAMASTGNHKTEVHMKVWQEKGGAVRHFGGDGDERNSEEKHLRT